MIDTHCHIDLYQNPLNLAEEAERRGIITIAVTNLPSHFERLYPYLRKFRNVRPALGFHPQLVKKHRSELPMFQRMISKTSYIGEVGLDFSGEGKFSKNTQIDTLKSILDCIRDRPRFITLHSRNAEAETLEVLEQFHIKGAVFHWYSGSLTLLEQVIKSGHYFSINHAMIRSQKGKKIIEMIPMDRILTESDGPYIQFMRRQVRPTDIKMLLDALRDIWRLNINEVDKQINLNFNRLISPLRLHSSNESQSKPKNS